jgi:ubiquinone biosynthesis protein COQ4
MGYRYLDHLATEENIRKFVDLADLAAGAGASPDNLHELMQRLRHSKPMHLCEKRLASDPASAALIAARYVAPPYDAEALLSLPRGSLAHTFAAVIKAMG